MTSNIFDIELCVQDYALSNIKSFCPSSIEKVVKLRLDIIIEKLLNMTKENKLKLLWEIRCPECYRTCLIIEDKKYMHDGVMDCDLGHEFQIDYNNIFFLFEITDEYIQSLKKYEVKNNSKYSINIRGDKELLKVCGNYRRPFS